MRGGGTTSDGPGSGGTRRLAPVPSPEFTGDRTPVVTVGHSVRALVLVGVVAAVLCAVVYAAFVLTPAGQWLAELILYGRPAGTSDAGALATDTLATISLSALAAATIAIAGVAAAEGRRRLAVGVVIAIGGANVTTQLLKRVVLDRPNLIGDAAYAAGNSFPSGHVTVAASLVLAALLVVPRPLRPLGAVAGGLYIAAVAASTLAAGWHRIGDAVGGMLIALAWTSIVAAAIARGWSAMPRRSWGFGSGARVAGLMGRGGVIALVLGAGILVLAWISPEFGSGNPAGTDTAPRAFIAGLAIISGAALMACGSLLWAMRGIALDRG